MTDKSQKRSTKTRSKSQSAKAEQALKESDQIRQREENIADIRSQFIAFGHNVVNHMVGEYVRYGHLKTTLRILNLKQPPEIEQQCDLIMQHLEQVGPQGLMKNVQMHQGASDQQCRQSAKDDDTGDLGEQILTEAEMRLMQRVMDNRPASKTDTVVNRLKREAHQKDDEDARGTQTKEKTPSSPAPPTEAPSDDGVTICPRTGRPMKNNKYIERRSGKDRRQSPDRRANLEVVFKNRRFGGDRRSGEDRRKNPWTPPADPDQQD